MKTNNFKNTNFDSYAEQHLRFTVIYGIVGTILLSIYAIINFIILDLYPAILEASMALVALAITIATVKTKELKWGKYFGPIPIFVMSLHNFFTGGFDNTGFLWAYTLPLIAIFLSGNKLGRLYCGMYILFVLFYTFIFGSRYPLILSITHLVSFACVILLTVIFQNGWDRSNNAVLSQIETVNKSKEELAKNIIELEKAKEFAEESLRKMKEANSQIEHVNESMTGRELKMIELKEKVRLLEEKLNLKNQN